MLGSVKQKEDSLTVFSSLLMALNEHGFGAELRSIPSDASEVFLVLQPEARQVTRWEYSTVAKVEAFVQADLGPLEPIEIAYRTFQNEALQADQFGLEGPYPSRKSLFVVDPILSSDKNTFQTMAYEESLNDTNIARQN